MKHRTRYVLALTLLATTLCAARLFASDRGTRSESRPVTEKLVARLTRSFSQTVSRIPLVVQQQTATPVFQPLVTASLVCDRAPAISPLQSNLPPPTL